jgi:CRISPR/Cas system-associated endoribonuclease Cas2
MMVIDPQRLRRRQRRFIVVQMPPLRLHQRQIGDRLAVRVVKMRDGAAQIIRRRQKIGIEDRDEIGIALLAANFQRTRLVTAAVGAMQHADVQAARVPQRTVSLHHRPRCRVG